MLFQAASQFVINGGVFNDVGGNGNTVNVTHVTNVYPVGPIAYSHRARISDGRNDRPRRDREVSSLQVYGGGRFEELPARPEDSMRRIEDAFGHIEHLIAPYSGNVFRKLHIEVCELKTVVAFSYRAYRACKRTDLGPLVRKDIGQRITTCVETLERVHARLASVLHGWVPIWQWVGNALGLSENFVNLIHWELEDIVSIRVEIARETESFGESLCSLKSFNWVQQLLLPFAGRCQFSMQDLDDFFRSGPPSLRHIQIGEIIVVEPLGDRLAIPIRFIDSVEDIHLCLQEGCRKSQGSRYIENKEYELDESGTDLPVDTAHLRRYLQPGSVLEVTVLLQVPGIESSQCPRPNCGRFNVQTEQSKATGWMRCEGCRMPFNTVVEEGSSGRWEEVNDENEGAVRNREVRPLPTGPIDGDGPLLPPYDNNALPPPYSLEEGSSQPEDAGNDDGLTIEEQLAGLDDSEADSWGVPSTPLDTAWSLFRRLKVQSQPEAGATDGRPIVDVITGIINSKGSDPSFSVPSRTIMNRLFEYLKMVGTAKHLYQQMFECHGEEGNTIVDSIQMLLDFKWIPAASSPITLSDRLTILKILLKLCANAETYPECLNTEAALEFHQLAPQDRFSGQVFKGTYMGEEVAVKSMSFYSRTTRPMPKTMTTEALLWSQLDHTNILPLYGMYGASSPAENLRLVSPWMPNGNVVDYLERNPSANRVRLINSIARGLKYLHGHGFIHGNLQGVNILVSASGCALISGFSMLEMRGYNPENRDELPVGAVRWQLPEALDEGTTTKTTKWDIYSFACVCYEILFGKVPFYEYSRDATIVLRVLQGENPSRPPDSPVGDTIDELWKVLLNCWDADPKMRPAITSILQREELFLKEEDLGDHALRYTDNDRARERTRTPRFEHGLTHFKLQVCGSSFQTLEKERPSRILFYVRALHDHTASDDEEFTFQAGDIIGVTATPDNGRWVGELLDDDRRFGDTRSVFPRNLVALF